MDIYLETKNVYENTYCTCAEKLGIQAWCSKWSTSLDESFCILNGGVQSRFCPGAWQLTIDGREVNDYLSSDPFICAQAESKFSISTSFLFNLWCTEVKVKFLFDKIIVSSELIVNNGSDLTIWMSAG